jgi:hypothetical protein
MPKKASKQVSAMHEVFIVCSLPHSEHLRSTIRYVTMFIYLSGATFRHYYTFLGGKRKSRKKKNAGMLHACVVILFGVFVAYDLSLISDAQGLQ